MKSSDANHNHALDGVRGVACLIVVLSHMDVFFGTLASPMHGYSQASGAWQLYNRLINGNFAVCVFFILSGYVLLAGYAKHRDPTALSIGFVKRYLRLTPLIFVAIMGTYLVGTLIGFSNGAAAQLIGGHAWLAGNYNFPFSAKHAVEQGLWGVYQGDVSYDGPLWSLSIELWGSLFIFAFAGLFYSQARLPLIGALTILGLVTMLGESGVYAGLFVCGAVLLKLPKWRGNWYLMPPAVFLAAENPWTPLTEATTARLTMWHVSLGATPDIWFHAIAACLLISAVLGNNFLRAAFSIRPIVWLGKISFSLYACHIAIMMSLGCWTLVTCAHAGHLRLGAALAIAVTLARGRRHRGAADSLGRPAFAALRHLGRKAHHRPPDPSGSQSNPLTALDRPWVTLTVHQPQARNAPFGFETATHASLKSSAEARFVAPGLCVNGTIDGLPHLIRRKFNAKKSPPKGAFLSWSGELV